MALQGCCGCGLRGSAKTVGNLFLVITLMQLLSVIMAWVLFVKYPTNVQGFGVDTPGGQFGVKLRETQSLLGGRGEDVTLNLGKFGKFGGSISSEGRVSLSTPGGEISSDGQRHRSMPGLGWMAVSLQIPFLSYCTIFVLLALMFNSMLIHGTNNDSSCAVLAWLVFYGAVFVVTSLGSIVGVIAAMGLGNTGDGVAAPIGVGSGAGLLLCALLWFWWTLVLTFYRELRDGTRGYKYHRDVSLQEPPTPRAPHPATQRKAEDYA